MHAVYVNYATRTLDGGTLRLSAFYIVICTIPLTPEMSCVMSQTCSKLPKLLLRCKLQMSCACVGRPSG